MRQGDFKTNRLRCSSNNKAVLIQQHHAHVTYATARAHTDMQRDSQHEPTMETKVATHHFASPSSTPEQRQRLCFFDHKFRIFMLASFGLEILDATSWAKQQTKPIIRVSNPRSGTQASQYVSLPHILQELRCKHSCSRQW